jgi:ectoine hydroxylase-related dioxygenase (phytanoyl-CoA dioxygenase family)
MLKAINSSEYVGLAITKTLHKLKLYPLPPSNGASTARNLPSLAETKIAKVVLPSEELQVPKLTLDDLSLSKEEANVESVSARLEKYGVCVVRNFLSPEEVSKVRNELDPIFEAKKDDPRLFPKETIRVTGAVSKSPTFVREVLAHPLNVEVSEKFLAKKNAFWIGENINIGYSPSIVSSSIGFRVGPGAPAQAIHRDDHSEHNINSAVEAYKYGRDTQVGISVALSNVTKENGGTRFIPGSHLWDHLRKPRVDEQCMHIDGLEEGDAFFMLGSVFHGAGTNVTADQYRTLLILFMCSATSRQKENIYLTTPIDYWKQFNVEELRLLGLSMSEPFSGMLELQDPTVALRPGYIRRSNYSDICKVVPTFDNINQ